MKKRKQKRKCRSQRMHAVKRAKERFGVALTKSDIYEFVKDIRKRKAKLLKKQSKTVSAWKIQIGDVDAVAIYCKSKKQILTLITMDMWSERN